jgi:hypothetical protein
VLWPPARQLLDPGLHRLVAFDANYSQLFQLDVSTQSGLPVELPRQDIGLAPGAGTLDSGRHRVFLGEGTCRQLTSPLCLTRRPRIIDVSLTGSFAASAFQLPDTIDKRFDGRSIKALGYDPVHATLYALTGLNASSVDGTSVEAFNASASDGSLTLKWSYPVDLCGDIAGLDPSVGVTPDGSALYFACRGISEPFKLTTLTFAGVMVVNIGGGDPTHFTVDQYPVGRRLDFSATAVDPGRQRLALTATSADGGIELRVFDVGRRAWVGTARAGWQAYGIAVDAGSGRFYVFNPSRTAYLIDVGDSYVRRTQQVDVGVTVYTSANPAVDPATRRLYIVDGWFGSDLRVHQDLTALP